MTIFFRLLSGVIKGMTAEEALKTVSPAFYRAEELINEIHDQWIEWFTYYLARLARENETDQERKENMDRVNPKYVLRNYMAQLAIDQADQGDYALISELYNLLTDPYGEQPEQEKWFAKRPEWARHKVGCSMLSCSS